MQESERLIDSLDKEFRKKNITWRIKTSLLRQPQRIQFIGNVLLWAGLAGSLLARTFSLTTDISAKASLAFTLCSLIGILAATVAEVFMGSPWSVVASPIFFIAMLLLVVSQILFLIQESSYVVVSLVSAGFIILAMIFFFIGCKDTFRLPALGPHNYLLLGGIFFTMGSFFFISARVGLLVFASNWQISIEILSSVFFFLGGQLFWSSSSLVFMSSTNMVLHRYPSTAIFMNSKTYCGLYFVGAVVSFFGSMFFLIFSCFLVLLVSLTWGIFAGTVLRTISSVILTIAFWGSKDLLLKVSGLVQILAFGVVSACFSIFSVSTSCAALAIASGGLDIISGGIMGLRSLQLFAKGIHAVSVGNYMSFSCIFGLASGTSILVFGCILLMQGILDVRFVISWSFFRVFADTFQVMHASCSYDVAEALSFDSKHAMSWEADPTLPSDLIRERDWGAPSETVEVIIIGGGPAGLTAANEFGIRNVRTILFDFKDDVVPDSRFFLLNPATMEGLQRLNLDRAVVDAGQQENVGWGSCITTSMTHEDGRVFGNIPGFSRLKHYELGNESSRLSASRSTTCIWASQPAHRIVQSAQERVLLDKARSYSCVSVRFLHRLTDIYYDQSANEVIVQVENVKTGEITCFKSRFLLGCDGGASTVSRLCGTHFDGFVHLSASRSVYICAPDLFAKVAGKLCESHQYHIVRPNVGVAYFALRDAKKGLWTFHLHVLFDGQSPAAVSPDEMRDLVQEFAGPDVEFKVITDGRWRWNFSVARTFSKGPIFLAGDACHTWPPFLGNGGNTAYQDVTNLCWKIDGFLKGWAGQTLLDSYDLERRDQVLRGAMAVIANTPSPTRLKIAGKLLTNPLTRFIILAKWTHSTSGEHLGNTFCQNGLSYGCRYDFSPVVLGSNDSSAPPEDPFPIYIPKVVPGGRALHCEFRDVHSIHDHISMTSYTLFLTSGDGAEACKLLVQTFGAKQIPLSFVDVTAQLQAPRSGSRNEYAAKLWTRELAVICRPDLYVSWTLRKEENVHLTAAQADIIVSRLSGKTDTISASSRSMCRWLTWRMYEGMKPMRNVFTKGVLVKNTEKEKDAVSSKADVVKGNSVQQEAGTCESCNNPLDETSCFFNEHVVHAACLVDFRKNIGVTEKVCTFCSRMLAGEPCVSLNKSRVHERCLSEFKAFTAQYGDQEYNF